MQCTTSNCIEFQSYHTNPTNRMIHVLSFLTALAAITVLLKTASIFLMIPYFLFILLMWRSIPLILYMISMYICLCLVVAIIVLQTPEQYKVPLLIVIIILTYIFPELSHIYFNEPTYLYNRIYRENNLFTALYELITHAFNIVPFCLINVF